MGYSQVGKAVDFDSTIPWFESRYPSQLLSHQYLLDASTGVELITLLLISCEGIMIAGVNIDVAVVQLVELEIVILVVADSNSAGHPNNEGMVEKYTTHSHAGLSLSELCLMALPSPNIGE